MERHTDVLRAIAIGAAFAFAFPVFGYALSRMWDKFVDRVFGGVDGDPKWRNIWATFYLLLPILLLGMLVKELGGDSPSWQYRFSWAS
jgi:hypothetical protein